MDRIARELTGLRILDKNRGILTLIEEGSEPDGSRFLVHELGTLRLLQDMLDEWQRSQIVACWTRRWQRSWFVRFCRLCRRHIASVSPTPA